MVARPPGSDFDDRSQELYHKVLSFLRMQEEHCLVDAEACARLLAGIIATISFPVGERALTINIETTLGRVRALALEGFDEIEAAGGVEALRRRQRQ